MTLPVWNGTAAEESSGDLRVLVSPTVTVTDKATGSNATLFSDRAGTTGIGNPFTAGADGSIEFYVKPGRYKIVADDGSGNTATWEDQLIGTLHGIDQPQESDLAYYDNANDRWSRLAVAASTIIGRLASGAIKALTLEEARRLLGDPEHATASGSPADDYDSATNTTVPGDGVTITRDFQSANTTTTPTLDGKTITDRDGNALWAGAINGVHELQYASGTDTYRLLDPRPTASNVNNAPVTRNATGDIAVARINTGLGAMEVGIDEDNMASNSATAVPTQQSTKAYADTKARIATGTYTGDGTTSQSIIGVGFQPKFLKIWKRETVDGTTMNVIETSELIVDDNASGGSVFHTAAGGHQFEIDRIISLDADGFTVDDSGTDLDPNINGATYSYMAIG